MKNQTAKVVLTADELTLKTLEQKARKAAQQKKLRAAKKEAAAQAQQEAEALALYEAQKAAEAAATAAADAATQKENEASEQANPVKRGYIWTVYTTPHYWQVPLLDALKAHAINHYAEGEHWDVVVEAMSDMDIINIVGRATTVKSYIERMAKHLKAYGEQVANSF